MAGAQCTGTENDEHGHAIVVGDIQRIFQLLENDPGSVITDGEGNALSVIVLDVCDNGVARKVKVLGYGPYDA